MKANLIIYNFGLNCFSLSQMVIKIKHIEFSELGIVDRDTLS